MGKLFLKIQYAKRWQFNKKIIVYTFFSKIRQYIHGACHSLFKLIHLRSIAKQVSPTYVNHSRPLIPGGIHFNKVWEEREARHILICWALSKEASGTIFITSLVWRGQGSNPRPPAHGANALKKHCKRNLKFSEN